jgi:hypothetical protein
MNGRKTPKRPPRARGGLRFEPVRGLEVRPPACADQPLARAPLVHAGALRSPADGQVAPALPGYARIYVIARPRIGILTVSTYRLHERNVPLYEDLVRRAVEAKARSARLHRDSRLICDLAQILRDAHAGKITIRRCSWCDRFRVGGEWLHLEAIGQGQQLVAASLLGRATNGICDECLERELNQTRAYQEARRPH